MNVADLRASILQAAIEGKLVPQLESEPEVEQIGEAPEEVPFEIPNKWKWVRLSSVQFLIRGITFPASAKHKEPKVGLIRCLTTGSVQQTHRPVSDVYVKSEYVKNNKQYLRRGDVVLSSANSRELVGKNIIWSCDAANVSFGGFLTVARSRTDVLASEFAYVVYQYLFVSGKFMEIATQTTNIANISNKVLAEIALPVPPLAEQRRIVARLNELLPLVDEFGEAQKAFTIAQTEFPGKLKASLLQAAIEGKLVPQLESEPEVEQISETPEDVPFTIPLKWKWATIGDSLQYGSSEQVNGQSIPRNAWVLDLEDIEKESGRLLIKKRNISNRSNKAKFKKGDVLYGKLRPYLNKCIIADEAGFSTTEIVAIRPKEGNYKFDAEYLKAFLMSPFFVNYANQASYGVKMPRLGTKEGVWKFLWAAPGLINRCRV